jgi:hypothetical protein|tara:strand:- start:1107 stop:1811 length:705 start_codon:yes stop_codon:yes gene_type:complete
MASKSTQIAPSKQSAVRSALERFVVSDFTSERNDGKAGRIPNTEATQRSAIAFLCAVLRRCTTSKRWSRLLGIHAHLPLTATLQLVEMLAGDASADVVARTRWFASPMASREATQSSIDFRRFAKMSWRQRCLALHRLTRVAAPSFESSFSGQMSEANLEWRARAQLYCGPHVREEASAAAAAAAEALPSAASASSADAKKSKSLLQAHGTDEALTAAKLPLKREPVSNFDSKS